MRGQTEITIGFRAGAGANGTPRGSSVSGSHRLKQIRLILMTCIDSELLCVLLFKCPFSVWHPQGEISPLWSALSYGKPRLLWLSWKIPRKSSHVLMMERGELWSYGVLIMGVIKIDSNALVCGSCGAFIRVSVPRWSSSMQSLRAPAGGGKVLKCCSCEYDLDINLRSWAIQGWQQRSHLDFSHDAWGTKRWTKVKHIVCQHKGLQSRGPL